MYKRSFVAQDSRARFLKHLQMRIRFSMSEGRAMLLFIQTIRTLVFFFSFFYFNIFVPRAFVQYERSKVKWKKRFKVEKRIRGITQFWVMFCVVVFFPDLLQCWWNVVEKRVIWRFFTRGCKLVSEGVRIVDLWIFLFCRSEIWEGVVVWTWSGILVLFKKSRKFFANFSWGKKIVSRKLKKIWKSGKKFECVIFFFFLSLPSLLKSQK